MAPETKYLGGRLPPRYQFYGGKFFQIIEFFILKPQKIHIYGGKFGFADVQVSNMITIQSIEQALFIKQRRL